MAQQWAQPGDQSHEIYPASSNVRNGNGDEMITAYAVHRPDGLWSLLLINRDPKRSFQTNVVFRKAPSDSSAFVGRVDIFQYSSKQYLLGGPANNPYPIRADEPEHRVIQSSGVKPAQISLPPYSLTVVRGALESGWDR